jgi:hypothetical protein
MVILITLWPGIRLDTVQPGGEIVYLGSRNLGAGFIPGKGTVGAYFHALRISTAKVALISASVPITNPNMPKRARLRARTATGTPLHINHRHRYIIQGNGVNRTRGNARHVGT